MILRDRDRTVDPLVVTTWFTLVFNFFISSPYNAKWKDSFKKSNNAFLFTKFYGMLHSQACYTLLVFREKPFQLPFFYFSLIFEKELLISVTCELHPSPHLLYPPMLNLKLNCLEGVGRGGGGETEGALKVPIARSSLAVLLRPSPPVCACHVG